MEDDKNEIMDRLSQQYSSPFSERFGEFCVPESKSKDAPVLWKPRVSFSEKVDFNDSTFQSSALSDELSEAPEEGSFLDKCTASKTFQCPVKACRKIYTSSYGLKYHIDHGHTSAKKMENRPYICPVDHCGKSYKNNNGLKYHIVHAHKGYRYDDEACIY